MSYKIHFLLLDPNRLLNRMSAPERNSARYTPTVPDDSSVPMISDENTNINMNSKDSLNSITAAAKQNPNVLHTILSQQRPIAPKNGSPTATKGNIKKDRMRIERKKTSNDKAKILFVFTSM